MKRMITLKIQLTHDRQFEDFDLISNEILKYGSTQDVIRILCNTFNCMVNNGYCPDNFNISLVTSIPKKGKMESVDDFRPISVSSAFAIIYKRLILKNIDLSN